MIVRENVALAPLTTFHIGGPARYFIEATSEEDVRAALQFADEKGLKLAVLGGGSNVLVADDGFDGVVLHINVQGIENEIRGDHEWITAGAGASWDDLVAWTIAHDLSGFEALSGVPGTVGGAVVQNLGCYGAQISDTFVHASVIDRHAADFHVEQIVHDTCRFSYHDSIFGQMSGRYLILSATFALSRGLAKLPAYKDSRFDTAAFVAEHHRPPTLTEVRELILTIREQKGVLASSYRSAGSFFHMPFVTKDEYEYVQEVAQKLDAGKEERLRPWAWEQPSGAFKLAPGFLLEYTEFQKGYRRGSVGISPKHTLTIINVDSALAHEVATLARDIQSSVKVLFSVQLEREVEYIGDVEK